MAKKDKTIERDAHDGGVPMIPATEPRSEPVGPEDALGVGPKRGDYSNRLGGSNYNPHTIVEVVDEHDDGTVETRQIMVDQKAFVSDIGDEVGQKGGVDTHTDRAAAESGGLQSAKPAKDSGSGSGSSAGS